jgi:hypothetical protein
MGICVINWEEPAWEGTIVDCFEKLSFLLVNKTEENHEIFQSIVTINRLEPEIFPHMKQRIHSDKDVITEIWRMPYSRWDD